MFAKYWHALVSVLRICFGQRRALGGACLLRYSDFRKTVSVRGFIWGPWPRPGSFDSVSDCQLLSHPTSRAPNLKAGAANWGPEAVTSLRPPSNGNGPHIQHIDQI